jgi:transcription antitermination factor NusG
MISQLTHDLTEPSLYSETVDAQWFVLHCRPRQEQCVLDHLAAQRVHAYAPHLQQVRFYGKRKVKKAYPLFPGYVFLKGCREDAYSVDRVRGVVQIIDPPDQDQLEWELSNVNMALELNAPLVECARLRVGTRVEVRSGPFKGMQGLIEASRSDDRIVLQVDMLGRAMSVEIDASLLDRIEDESLINN